MHQIPAATGEMKMRNMHWGIPVRASHWFMSMLITLTLATPAGALDAEFSGDLRDAWLTGKAETVLALNEHLNRYSIGARVTDGIVTLSGAVASDIDRSLATELMKGIAGIRSVDNRLKLGRADADDLEAHRIQSRSSFARWIDDLTTTAIVRSRLIRHEDVKGMTIEVRTSRNVVTLEGEVQSASESALIEEIVRNSGGVDTVVNRLLISSPVEISSQ